MNVSAVIPAYNAEPFLARAIQSVLEQTCLPMEVIVVDDGSTDGTADVIWSFGEAVRCIRQDNAGVSAARNRGIQEARGEFVAFLDADDEWLPHHLARAAEVFRTHPQLNWFWAAYVEVLNSGERFVCDAPPEMLIDGCYVPDACLAAARGIRFRTSVTVVRKVVLDQVGLFDPQFAVGEDLDLWFRIALRHPEAGYSNDVAAYYRYREGSLTTLRLADARKWLNRIRHDENIARELGDEAVKRGEPLLMSWVAAVIRTASREGDCDTLRDIKRYYGRRVPLKWRLVSLACRWLPRAIWSTVVRFRQAYKAFLDWVAGLLY